MKYYEDFSDELSGFKYDEEAELNKVINKLKESGGKMSVEEYINFMHGEDGADEDLTMEVMLILCKLLDKHPDKLYIDYFGRIKLKKQ